MLWLYLDSAYTHTDSYVCVLVGSQWVCIQGTLRVLVVRRPKRQLSSRVSLTNSLMLWMCAISLMESINGNRSKALIDLELTLSEGTRQQFHKSTIFPILQWLEETFLPYLDKWEANVKDHKVFSITQKKVMLLSKETRDELRMTGTIVDDHDYVCVN